MSSTLFVSAPPSPLSDAVRLRAVHSLNPASIRERRLDYICAEASKLLQAPVVHMSVVDEDEQYFVAAYGLPEDIDEVRRVGLEYSICQYVVTLGTTLIIRDALQEPFLLGNLAVSEWGVRSYLGEPVRTPDGAILGSFCALAYEPRDWSEYDRLVLLRMTQLATAALLAP